MKTIEPPKKRTWHYLGYPAMYEVFCLKCNGSNTWWSEFEKMIWCYDCKEDNRGTEGVFSGPIPMEAVLILGTHFHILDMEKDRILFSVQVRGKWVQRMDKRRENRIREKSKKLNGAR